MSDRPLEINEMAVRRLVQMIWFGFLSALIVWFIWPSILWGLDGFPESDLPPNMPNVYLLLLHAVLALLAIGWGLRAGSTFLFELLPFLLARAMQPKGPILPRR